MEWSLWSLNLNEVEEEEEKEEKPTFAALNVCSRKSTHEHLSKPTH
jgi:hypothetical protein